MSEDLGELEDYYPTFQEFVKRFWEGYQETKTGFKEPRPLLLETLGVS